MLHKRAEIRLKYTETELVCPSRTANEMMFSYCFGNNVQDDVAPSKQCGKPFHWQYNCQPIASLPFSLLRMRMHSSSGTIKILPSPISPVWAPLMMASTV